MKKDFKEENVYVLNNSYKQNFYELEEFLFLLKTASFSVKEVFNQNIDEVSRSFFAGKGKIEEIAYILQNNPQNTDENNQIDYLICNFDLTPLQRKNIEKVVGIPVIDRTSLILRIFELNAKTKEAKLQVEIAKLDYLKGQLIDGHASYSQITGGSMKARGPGEKQIELNRRLLEEVIFVKNKELEEIRLSRKTMRQKRLKSSLPNIVVVGYTNAGKSTLINSLLNFAKKSQDKMVYAENQLFATLETSTRLISTYRYPSFLLTDTVGFISHLPISLIKAFRSTLEEIQEADLIVEVVDVSNENYKEQIEVSQEILKQLKADQIPCIYLLNKCDSFADGVPFLPKKDELLTSLIDPSDAEPVIKFICEAISEKWEEKTILFPYKDNFKEFLDDNYVIQYKEKEDGYECLVRFNPLTIHKYKYLFS